MEAAGVSASQVHHCFDAKRGLVSAVIDRLIEASLNSRRPVLDQLDSFESLQAWCDAAVEGRRRRHCEGGCEIGSLAGELAESDAATRAEPLNAFERWEAPLPEDLARMQQRGELSADADVHDLATALPAAVQGGSLLPRTRRGTHPLKTATDSAIAYVETFATKPRPADWNTASGRVHGVCVSRPASRASRAACTRLSHSSLTRILLT